MKSKIGTVFLSLYLALTSANCDIRKPSSEPKQGVSSSQPVKQELEDVIKLNFEDWNFVLAPYRIAKDAFGAVIYAAREELKKKGQNEKDLSEQEMEKLLVGVCQKMDASKDSFIDNFEAEGYLHPDKPFDGKNPFYKPPEVAAVSKETDVKTEKPVVHEPEKAVEPEKVKEEPKYEGKVEVAEEKEPKYEEKKVEGPKEVISEREEPAKLKGTGKLEEIIDRKKKELHSAASKEAKTEAQKEKVEEKKTEEEPKEEKAAEVTGVGGNFVESSPEVGFEYSGASGILDEIKAVYDMKHDIVRVLQDGDVYIVKPKSGDSALYIKIEGETIEPKYEPGENGFIGGTIEEQNAIGAEADTDKKDGILTRNEMSKLIYNSFQAWKAKHPEIEQVKPEEHRDDYFKSKDLEDLEDLFELLGE